MSDETPGAGQGALPPREGQGPRPLAERPATTMRLAHVVGGQYVLTTQAHGMPSLTQINPGTLPANTNLTQTGITRIISISPSRVTQTNPLRPSLANQSIVNVLTKPRTNANVRLQLFSGDNATQNAQHPVHQRPVKRPADRKDYAAKLQHVMNHRIVRSKLVKEKYNEHLLEAYHLETGNNILDLYQYAKRPKTQAHLAYLREHAVDPQEAVPSATSASSLPGISTSTPTVDRVKTKTPAPSSQDLIVEKAKQEAYVVQRVAELQKEGLWSEKRLPKVQEMHRAKAHWDFLLEEMVWLAADFAQERKWKKAAAKKCARMVQKHFQDKALAAQKAERALEQNLRRIAGFCAKEVKLFWGNVEKLVEFKQNTILEEKRKRALDQQLSFIVDQTEKYSQLLAEGMNKTTRGHLDVEFHPDLHTDDEDDDEETIEQEEAAAAGDSAGHLEEVEALRKESQMELDDLLEDDLLRDYLLNRDKIRLSESEESDGGMKGGSSEAEDSDSTEEEEESEEEAQKPADELKLLVEDSHKEGDGKKTEEDDKDRIIDDAAAIAESIQPKGNTLSSTNVSTNIPFLLKYSLREYQHIGLDWLVTMYERKLNGILADEMGLGKTIQTIALLAHLACEKGDWGPHLIVVPTSVMLNWEMECKKWCPAFKILTYYGSQKERKLKRTGWTKPNAFHICITSYKLVIQDHQSFRRKKWKYLILDEAQNIKNFKSQRWQLLLNFQTQQRLLLTGTPLQNNLMELWSLMHFLMPNVFQSHREFKEWFSNPVTGMIEGNSEYNENIIKRLHKVLRPFLLRRLKSEVEKQMPKKYEHVVVCRLSKRQRYLYDDYMSRAKTRETLASGNMLSVINVLMQLRKVCNHPNLFEVRPTISPFQCEGISLHIPSIVYSALDYDPDKHVNFEALNLLLIMQEIHFSSYQCYRMRQSRHSRKIIELDRGAPERPPCPPCKLSMRVLPIKGAAATAGRPNVEKKEVAVAQPPPLQLKGLAPQNVKVKVAGMQLLNQQGILKTIPVVNISQGATSQIGTPVNVTSLLKPADKISASFAQLVQTSTGKHLLLTSNPNITANIPVTSTTGGQKLTFLSKQPVSTIGSTGHAVTKAFVKFQLSSVTTATTVSTVTTNSGTVSVVKSDDKLKASRAQIGNDYIGRLYSKQNSLDVRWQNEDKAVGVPNEEDPKGERRNRLMLMASINKRRCSALPLYGRDFQDAVKIFSPNKIDPWQGGTIHCLNTLYNKTVVETTSCLSDMLYSPERRIETLKDICDRFIFCVPAVRSAEPALRVCHPPPSRLWGEHERRRRLRRLFSRPATALHRLASATVTQFPDPRLIQYDCGKLQTLDGLLRSLRSGGHRALIFTQMTRMLDVLEAFLNFHGHIYLRLDGTTKVDQRQVLMERFNGDKRIFAFILSTRSGGVGVNLTGADTVIFYDSDWNPTMDAQAQDRCHRIGQTRDVHIYRLVSERTIEENILKKANQKRLLGDLAIEGGNFTTAFFKSSTIQDLFDVDQKEDASSEAFETKTTKEALASAGDEKSAMGALESALAACEDDQDVQAAKTAKAEAVADLAEFDENIPLDEHEAREPEVSKAEAEINNIIEKLSPIEKYAMKFIEATESAWSAEQLAAAEREIEQQKRDWERDRLAAMREEEERRARDLEDDVDLLTFSREDAANQIWVSDNTTELMPMWCPPTPPQQDGDLYVDHAMAFLYDTAAVMGEADLPPAYVRREAKRSAAAARQQHEPPEGRRPPKVARREEPPRSLFHSPGALKVRRDLKMQKYRGLARPPPGAPKQPAEQPLFHEWTVHEDMALLKAVQGLQGLPLSLAGGSPGHTANWDFVSDYVNTVSITYRSPKQCRQRYESHLTLREEGKPPSLEGYLRKKKSRAAGGGAPPKHPSPGRAAGRPARTAQLYAQDNNAAFSRLMCERFECLRAIAGRKAAQARSVAHNPLINKAKSSPASSECGIDLEHPVLPVEVAARRAERLAREKKSLTSEQKQFAARLHLMKGIIANQQQAHQAAAGPSAASGGGIAAAATAAAASTSCQVVTQAAGVVSAAGAATAAAAAPGTPPNALRTQRIIASPIQPTTMVSVSGLSPAQLQAATQRLIVSAAASGAALQAKTSAAATVAAAGKAISQSQFAMLRQANLKQQLRLKTSTVTIGGQQAVVQLAQAQPRAQLVAGGGRRTVTESEMAQLLKKQQQLQQQQKLLAAAAASGAAVQGLSPQVLAQAMQAGGSGATLVKTVVSSAGVTQTVSIPVTGVSLGTPGKTLTPTLKAGNASQLRQLQLQQQLLAQKKLGAQKLGAAAQAAAGKSGAQQQAQLIVGAKPLQTAMTVQQFQQVIRSPMGVSQGPVVLAKAAQRVIPVNTSQGGKQTIQVVAATSQLNTALRPQSTSTLAGALAGLKAQGGQQPTLLSQVSAALGQGVGVRQGSPVRIQTSNGTPMVAVSVQQQQQGASPQSSSGSSSSSDHVSRFLKK